MTILNLGSIGTDGTFLAAKIAIAFKEGQDTTELTQSLNTFMKNESTGFTKTQIGCLALDICQVLYGTCIDDPEDQAAIECFKNICTTVFDGFPLPNIDVVIEIGKLLTKYRCGDYSDTSGLQESSKSIDQIGNEILECIACREILNILMRSPQWTTNLALAKELTNRYDSFSDEIKEATTQIGNTTLFYLPVEERSV